MKPAFTVEQVRSFLGVADAESVSRAADALHLTQGAVTQQVHNFERALGVTLLERTGRGVRLTDAARSLVTSCRAAIRAFEVVADSARALKSLDTGSLHIGASPTCASYYLPALLAQFASTYPGVALQVTVEPTSELNERVQNGVLDCALVEGHPGATLTAVVLAWDELVLIAKADHPLAKLPDTSPAQLSKYRYLGRGRTWAAESTARELMGEAFDKSPVLNLGHPEYVRAAALAGLGYAALSVQSVKADLESGALKRLPGQSTKRAIHAVRRPDAGGPSLEAFWRLLVHGATKQD